MSTTTTTTKTFNKMTEKERLNGLINKHLGSLKWRGFSRGYNITNTAERHYEMLNFMFENYKDRIIQNEYEYLNDNDDYRYLKEIHAAEKDKLIRTEKIMLRVDKKRIVENKALKDEIEKLKKENDALKDELSFDEHQRFLNRLKKYRKYCLKPKDNDE